MTNINSQFYGRQMAHPQMNPDDMARKYASENNISLGEARTKLQEQYGTPQIQEQSIFTQQNGFNDNKTDLTSVSDIDFSDFDFSELDDQPKYSLKDIFQYILTAFRSGNGPQQEGDPQHHLSPEDNIKTTNQSSTSNIHNKGNDPDEYAQIYADERGISLEEAKAELKAKYGDPEKK